VPLYKATTEEVVAWKEANIVDLRREVAMRVLAGESVSAVARAMGVSRKTIRKAVTRFKAQGELGLQDRSRAPHRVCRRTPDEIEELIVAARQELGWGGKKLKRVLDQRHPGVRIPTRSTIDLVLARRGIVRPKRRPPRPVTPPIHLTQPTAPNHVWAIDYKGQFRTRDQLWCYPLTVSDLFSRFIIGCEAFVAIDGEAARAAMLEMFQTYGLPQIIRSDNGPPFASVGLFGLSKLSAWWRSIGIRHERIEPGRPTQNGVHERMHRTLKREATRPASAHLLAQQERFDRYRDLFNGQRPHEALGMKTPSDCYACSPQPLAPLRLEYPLHDDTLWVKADGEIFINRRKVYLSTALAHLPVGIREIQDDVFLVSFDTLDLGLINTRATHKPFTRFDLNPQPGSPPA
jgi:transposase InsO family protein